MRTPWIAAIGVTLAVLARPALADVAGRYESTDKKPAFNMEMTVEADDAGDVRVQMVGQASYFLLRAGQLYSVSRGATGPTVVRVADMLAIQEATLQRMGAADLFAEAKARMPRLEFAPLHPEQVGPWQGTAYGVKSDTGKVGPYALFVLSDDPRIAALGKGIAAMQRSMVGQTSNLMPGFGQLGQDFVQFLSKGTPIRMMSIELTDVSYDPISPDRFTLPTPPETLDQLKAQAEPFPSPPTLPPRKK